MFSESSCILNYHLTPKKLGSGSYGIVHEAIDPLTQKKAAIKKMSFVESDADFLSLYREISILRVLKGHSNIVTLDHVEISNHHIYLVFECYDTDLHKVIRSQQRLTIEHIRYFIHQILYGIEHIHSAKLVHRDLKPSNILVNRDCHIKICDFGLARAIVDCETTQGAQAENNLTNYVVTRWYRSPEVILISPRGGEAPTDIWSIGCILAELLLGRPVFPGHNQKEVLSLIFKLMGFPRLEENTWLDDCKNKLKLKSTTNGEGEFPKIFETLDMGFFILLRQLLEFNPFKRISAEQALKNAIFREFDKKEGETNTFLLESCSGLEQESFMNYIQFERQFSHSLFKRESLAITQQIQSLIQTEVRRYQSAESTTSLAEQDVSEALIPADISTSTSLPASTSASSSLAEQSFFSSSNTGHQISCSQSVIQNGPH
ncbi:MAG: mitogen-activated protein kinase 7/14 [Pseudomonadota bacterium]|nr:mitogen-activated protein kinase 7/14 [Pseudomonadota bacterium]